VNSQRVTPDQVLDDVATQLADIEALPLAQRAEALADLHERLREQLEVADTSITTEQS
jgi:predicted transcriptional regulator